MKTLIYTFATLSVVSSSPALALYPGHSWLTEFHSKRLGINCKSAQKQIDDVVQSVLQALASGRQVDLPGLGNLNRKDDKSAQVIFKPAKQMLKPK